MFHGKERDEGDSSTLTCGYQSLCWIPNKHRSVSYYFALIPHNGTIPRDFHSLRRKAQPLTSWQVRARISMRHWFEASSIDDQIRQKKRDSNECLPDLFGSCTANYCSQLHHSVFLWWHVNRREACFVIKLGVLENPCSPWHHVSCRFGKWSEHSWLGAPPRWGQMQTRWVWSIAGTVLNLHLNWMIGYIHYID